MSYCANKVSQSVYPAHYCDYQSIAVKSDVVLRGDVIALQELCVVMCWQLKVEMKERDKFAPTNKTANINVKKLR